MPSSSKGDSKEPTKARRAEDWTAQERLPVDEVRGTHPLITFPADLTCGASKVGTDGKDLHGAEGIERAAREGTPMFTNATARWISTPPVEVATGKVTHNGATHSLTAFDFLLHEQGGPRYPSQAVHVRKAGHSQHPFLLACRAERFISFRSAADADRNRH